MTFKVGDSILVPKGTPAFFLTMGMTPEHTKRDSRSTVKQVADYNYDPGIGGGLGWAWFISREEERQMWQEIREWGEANPGAPRRYIGTGAYYADLPGHAALKKAVIERVAPDGDMTFVQWGDRLAHHSYIRPAEAKPAKERAITNKTRMVIGSKWRLTQGIQVYFDQKAKTGLLFEVKAGTEFTVFGKPRAAGRGQGTGIPAEFADKSDVIMHVVSDSISANPWEWNGLHLPYALIEKIVEPLHIPEKIVYLLEDSETGKFFAGFDHDWGTGIDHLKMSETLSAARKFEKVNNIMASIMSFTGYGDGLDAPDTAYGMNQAKKMDLPPTWQIVAYDAVSKTRSDKPVTDIQAWYKNLMRLRVLTQRYGSAVRKLYKEIEGRGKIEDGDVMLAVSYPEYWALSLSDDDFAEALAEVFEMPAKKRVKGDRGCALLCSRVDAMKVVLRWAFPHTTAEMYNPSTLEEEVAQ